MKDENYYKFELRQRTFNESTEKCIIKCVENK